MHNLKNQLLWISLTIKGVVGILYLSKLEGVIITVTKDVPCCHGNNMGF